MFKSINGGILPCRSTRHSAGFDVYSNEDVVIEAGETKLIGLGIALDDDSIRVLANGLNVWRGMELHEVNNMYLALHIRSSLRAKGLTSLGTGIIDMDYRDEIKMVIHNPTSSIDLFFQPHAEIKKGDKIGQLILCRHEGWLLPSEYTKDVERDGGFGSTGER